MCAIVTDIPWIHEPTGEIRRGMYMDKWLAQNLERIPDHLKKGWDVVCIVSGTGMVRTGKSCSYHTSASLFENGKKIISRPLGSYKNGTILNTISLDFKTGKIVPSKSEVIIEKEPKKFYNVKLKDGRNIECSMEHKLFVKTKKGVIEKKLKDINVGDKIICDIK
jgi:intein/homing endonuclease